MSARRKQQVRANLEQMDCGPYELRLGSRVSIDVLIAEGGEVMAFLRVDGSVVTELRVAGVA